MEQRKVPNFVLKATLGALALSSKVDVTGAGRRDDERNTAGLGARGRSVSVELGFEQAPEVSKPNWNACTSITTSRPKSRAALS
jgi:hypothetical protein